MMRIMMSQWTKSIKFLLISAPKYNTRISVASLLCSPRLHSVRPRSSSLAYWLNLIAENEYNIYLALVFFGAHSLPAPGTIQFIPALRSRQMIEKWHFHRLFYALLNHRVIFFAIISMPPCFFFVLCVCLTSVKLFDCVLIWHHNDR